MILEACEQVLEAYAHVGRCADAAWTPKGDLDPYRLANQELWIREWRLQEQYNALVSANAENCTSRYAPRTVHDTIPRSRFARIYAIGREYDPERELYYVPSFDLGSDDKVVSTDDVSYADIECWQIPEVEACFRELIKGQVEPDFHYPNQNDPSVADISNQDDYKMVNISDKDWISQVPWRAILSERYPAMRELLDKSPTPSKNYICSDTSFGVVQCPITRYSATTLPELALQMKLHSAEVRAIWNDNMQCPKRPRRTPRLPMEPSKRFLNADVAEFYPINPENIPSEYSLFQGNNFSIQNHIYMNLRENIDHEFDSKKINGATTQSSDVNISFDEIIDKSSENIDENSPPKSILSVDKVYKISHSQSSVKISNYVRNVPSNLKGKYSPSSIQGIEFNPIFTPENSPNVEEQFSRTPGSSRHYMRKNRTKKCQLKDSGGKSDPKTAELFEALSKISTEVLDDEKIHIETSTTSENIDVKVSKTVVAMKNQCRPKLLTKTSAFALSEQNLIVAEELNLIGDEHEAEKSVEKSNRKVQFLLNNKQITYQIKKKQINNADIPEFVPCFQSKENIGINLKISSSLPNISESSDIPEFYPKEYHNAPKKAASVYDKPLRNTKVILPENTSNSINLDARIKSNEHPIPVYQRPREFYTNTPTTYFNIGKQRKQQGVDFNNLILLTPNGKEPRKWLHNEYPNRLNEFDRVDHLINRLSTFMEQIPSSKDIFCESQSHDFASNLYQNNFPVQAPYYVPNVVMQPMQLIPGYSGGNLMQTHFYNQHLDQTVLRVPYQTQNISPRTVFLSSNRRQIQAYQNSHCNFHGGTATACQLPHASAANASVMPQVVTEMQIPYSFPQNLPKAPTGQSKNNLSPTTKSPMQSTSASAVLNQNQGAKRRLYSAVLSNTNATMDSEYDELERQALEQYRPSEESLKGSSDDSIQAKFQELERLAMEQYSSSSGSSESCALGQTTNPESLKSIEDMQSASNIRNVYVKGSTIRKSNSNLSMSSKKSAVLLPSIGEVSNDEADSPTKAKKPNVDPTQSVKRKLIILKPSNRPVFSDHSSDGEDNDDCGPQIIATFTDRSQAVFRTPSMMVTINNSSLNEFSPIKSDNCFENVPKKSTPKTSHEHQMDHGKYESNTLVTNVDNSNAKESKVTSRNRRRQGRNSKKAK